MKYIQKVLCTVVVAGTVHAAAFAQTSADSYIPRVGHAKPSTNIEVSASDSTCKLSSMDLNTPSSSGNPHATPDSSGHGNRN